MMDQAFTVTAGQFLLLCGMIIVGLVASWGITFYSMKGESKLAAALGTGGPSYRRNIDNLFGYRRVRPGFGEI
jgi:hypothetical protein